MTPPSQYYCAAWRGSKIENEPQNIPPFITGGSPGEAYADVSPRKPEGILDWIKRERQLPPLQIHVYPWVVTSFDQIYYSLFDPSKKNWTPVQPVPGALTSNQPVRTLIHP